MIRKAAKRRSHNFGTVPDGTVYIFSEKMRKEGEHEDNHGNGNGKHDNNHGTGI